MNASRSRAEGHASRGAGRAVRGGGYGADKAHLLPRRSEPLASAPRST